MYIVHVTCYIVQYSPMCDIYLEVNKLRQTFCLCASGFQHFRLGFMLWYVFKNFFSCSMKLTRNSDIFTKKTFYNYLFTYWFGVFSLSISHRVSLWSFTRCRKNLPKCVCYSRLCKAILSGSKAAAFCKSFHAQNCHFRAFEKGYWAIRIIK